ncbi:hypothetical protein FACS1894137_18420 [Spirochaetia bacterium]|nr:hypothetical protein FACS1894137_18420 [Spirochaetia bacterium]
MNYVLHENKRLYFPREFDDKKARLYYYQLLTEQDQDSPHRYETSEFHVQDGDCIADIGSAEGIFALKNVERADKIYLFECDEKWIEALEKTFAPWNEKVVIVNKYVCDTTCNEFITLDDFMNMINDVGGGGIL